jgi:hypothetical protein
MRPDLNIVKEVHPGVFGATMWCPMSRLLSDLLDPDYPHVLVCNHYIGRGGWEPFHLPIVTPIEPEAVLSRPAPFDFMMPTRRVLELLPKMPNAIRAVQLRQIPPNYFDLSRIRGTERFRLLKEYGWHVLLDTPAHDFGDVFSPDRNVVTKAVQLHQAGQSAAI